MHAGYDILLQGFPGRTPRGFLGWSTILLLHGPGGPVLFDTGDHGDRPGLIAALAARGLEPGDIGTVILSHLHFDHVANLECFPQARILLHESEATYFRDHGSADIAMPQTFARAILASPKLELLTGEPELWPGLRMIRTPGHSGGHASLVLDRPEGSVVLAQDAVKHRGELETARSDGAFDADAATESIRRIARIATVVVPGHDAPLRIEAGDVTPLAPVATEVSLTLDDRRFPLEV